jgi:hypothetical protein
MGKKNVFTVSIKSAFDIEEDKFYYVKTDPRQLPRQLTSLTLDIGSGGVLYGLTHGDEEEVCYTEMQISEAENILMREKYGDSE